MKHIRQIIAECPSITNRMKGPTMKGNRPVKQFVITKSAERERVPNIGGAWSTSSGEILSCRIKLPFDLPAGTELNFIAVPPSEPKAPENRPRKQAGQQPTGAA